MTQGETSMKKHKLLVAVIMFGLTSAGIVRAEDQPIKQQAKPTILLVHGAWADSSSWNGVVDLLLKDGYTVRALPNTLRGLSADAAVISTYLKSVAGPVVLAGHSYGGSVISVASANAPNVKALVLVDAFAPDAGESSLWPSKIGTGRGGVMKDVPFKNVHDAAVSGRRLGVI